MVDQTEILAAVVGAGIGGMAAYLLDIRRERRERHRERARQRRDMRDLRASIATALIQDIRMLEPQLRQFARSSKPALWVGIPSKTNFDALRQETRHLNPATLLLVNDFYWLTGDLFGMIASAPQATRNDPRFNWQLRGTSIFALQQVEPAVSALVKEGGRLPPVRTLSVVDYPSLPEIPHRTFRDQASDGGVLPGDLE